MCLISRPHYRKLTSSALGSCSLRFGANLKATRSIQIQSCAQNCLKTKHLNSVSLLQLDSLLNSDLAFQPNSFSGAKYERRATITVNVR